MRVSAWSGFPDRQNIVHYSQKLMRIVWRCVEIG